MRAYQGLLGIRAGITSSCCGREVVGKCFVTSKRFTSTTEPPGHDPAPSSISRDDPEAVAAVAELVFRCQATPQPLVNVVNIMTPSSLATIFKCGLGLQGFIKSHGQGRLAIHFSETEGTKKIAATPEGVQFVRNHSALVQGLETLTSGSSAAMDEERVLAQIRTLFLSQGGGKDTDGFLSCNELYVKLYPSPEARRATSFASLMKFLESRSDAVWVVKGHAKLRAPSEQSPPPLPSRLVTNFPRVLTATSLNNYGGWGTQQNVPTAADVYEVLKYIPIHWGNLGNVQIPAATKKRHVRISSFLQWLRRLPNFFEVRAVAGTTEVRRSVLLHPEEHGMTLAQAHDWLNQRIFSGEHNNIASPVVATAPVAPGSTSAPQATSAAAAALFKFALRVCPGYFVPGELILRRFSKKGLTMEELAAVMETSPEHFEVVSLRTGDKLFRRRMGSGGAKGCHWVAAVLEEINGASVALTTTSHLVALMNASSCLWDRPQYLYVRLPDGVKSAIGGYEGMMSLLSTHPNIFHCGKHFYCRVDQSNPLAVHEPAEADASMTLRLTEENPYLTPRDVAQVFHYVCPEGQSTTVSHFVECSSPAMRAVLPPRVLDLITLFPELFAVKEVSPGSFAIRKKEPRTGGVETRTPAAVLDDDDDGLTSSEVVDTVAGLIPPQGIEVSQLQVWLSMSANQAAVKHFGSLKNLLLTNSKTFEISGGAQEQLVKLKKMS